MPLFLKNNILGIFAKGSLGTAMFVAVMYAGALPKGSKLIAPLMKIRGELSITAAILVLCHNFTYGITYFRMLFIKPEALSATQLTAWLASHQESGPVAELSVGWMDGTMELAERYLRLFG